MSMNPSDTLRPGSILMNRYRVDELLGADGLGIVVAATDLDAGRKVALKLVRNPAPVADGQAALVGAFRRAQRRRALPGRLAVALLALLAIVTAFMAFAR